MLKLGILWCSKHSKCWGISTQHITSVKSTPVPAFPWPTNSDTLVFPRFFRGSSFLESHYLNLSQESLPFYQLMAESFGQTFPLLLAKEKGTDPKIAESTPKPAGMISWPILSFYIYIKNNPNWFSRQKAAVRGAVPGILSSGAHQDIQTQRIVTAVSRGAAEHSCSPALSTAPLTVPLGTQTAWPRLKIYALKRHKPLRGTTKPWKSTGKHFGEVPAQKQCCQHVGFITCSCFISLFRLRRIISSLLQVINTLCFLSKNMR